MRNLPVFSLLGSQVCPLNTLQAKTAFETWCLVYIHCYQGAGSKVGIYNAAAYGFRLDDALSDEFTEVRNKYGAENSDKTYTFCIRRYSA